MNKQPQRTAQTKSNLIDALLVLSEQKSIDKITVSELALKAGYNRSTFYQYFSDIPDMITFIEDDLLLYIKETVVSQIGIVHPEQFFIEGFTQINATKRPILKLLFGQYNNTFHIKLKNELIPLFAKQMHLTSIDEPTVYKLDFYLSGIIALISRWVTAEMPLSTEDYALLMQDIVESIRKSGLFPFF